MTTGPFHKCHRIGALEALVVLEGSRVGRALVDKDLNALLNAALEQTSVAAGLAGHVVVAGSFAGAGCLPALRPPGTAKAADRGQCD